MGLGPSLPTTPPLDHIATREHTPLVAADSGHDRRTVFGIKRLVNHWPVLEVHLARRNILQHMQHADSVTGRVWCITQPHVTRRVRHTTTCASQPRVTRRVRHTTPCDKSAHMRGASGSAGARAFRPPECHIQGSLIDSCDAIWGPQQSARTIKDPLHTTTDSKACHIHTRTIDERVCFVPHIHTHHG